MAVESDLISHRTTDREVVAVAAAVVDLVVDVEVDSAVVAVVDSEVAVVVVSEAVVAVIVVAVVVGVVAVVAEEASPLMPWSLQTRVLCRPMQALR